MDITPKSPTNNETLVITPPPAILEFRVAGEKAVIAPYQRDYGVLFSTPQTLAKDLNTTTTGFEISDLDLENNSEPFPLPQKRRGRILRHARHTFLNVHFRCGRLDQRYDSKSKAALLCERHTSNRSTMHGTDL
ncbi:hypothetical protein G7Y89_g4560 [Cudoniella acicularis]|uniref:Uncharacterized protein n=1 Tax=Cudoniella acicularis TaxID=354080 RepID=A0A8H4W4U9_9HELO|nr:hypothetical protein G7Y89_g4560 [Cudoniella acicularis]